MQRNGCRYSRNPRSRIVVLSERRSVSANAPNQFSEEGCARRPGIERRQRKRNFGRGENNELFDCEVGADNIDHCRCEALGWCCHNRAQNFAARLAARILRFTGLGMEWAGRGIGILPMLRHGLEARATMRDRAESAMIGEREPRKNSDQRGNAAPGNGHRFHRALIVELIRMLKLFLRDP